MTVARSELFGKVKARVQKAAEDIVASERGSAAVAEAMRRVQLGRKVIDEKATDVAASLGIATKADVERVARKIGKLRKQVQALIEAAEKRESAPALTPPSRLRPRPRTRRCPPRARQRRWAGGPTARARSSTAASTR